MAWTLIGKDYLSDFCGGCIGMEGLMFCQTLGIYEDASMQLRVGAYVLVRVYTLAEV